MITNIQSWVRDKLLGVSVHVKILGIGLTSSVVFGGGFLYLVRRHPEISTRAAIVFGLCVFVVLSMSILLTGLIVRPVKDLAQLAREVGEGNLEVKAPAYTDDEFGTLARTFNEMTSKLKKSERIKGQLIQKLFTVQEEERKRIARELHDQIGQTLSSMRMHLKNLFKNRGDVPEEFVDLEDQLADAIEEVRTLSAQMRPTVIDDYGLSTALRQYAQSTAEKYGINIDVETVGVTGEKRFDPKVEIALYRVAQEAILNAANHAEPDQISVILNRNREKIWLLVEDDGKGFDREEVEQSKQKQSLGLQGMRERMKLIDGKLDVESSRGRGTRVRAEISISGELNENGNKNRNSR